LPVARSCAFAALAQDDEGCSWAVEALETPRDGEVRRSSATGGGIGLRPHGRLSDPALRRSLCCAKSQ